MNHRRFFWAFALIGLILGSCNTAQTGTTEPATHPEPSETPLPPTETEAPTHTPVPTGTSTPTATATPTQTHTPTPDLTATAEVLATQAMATLQNQVLEDLESVGISPDRGALAWAADTTEDIHITAYNTHDWIPLGDGEVYSDFILKVDVTWESSSGLAVCGLWFRAQGVDEDTEHYKFQTLRLSGLPSWDVEYWRYNAWQATLSPGGRVLQTPHLDQDQGSTNTYIMLADGNLLTIFANGHRLGQVTISKLHDGLLAYYGWQESGITTCSFGNAWVWDLSES